MGITNYNKVKKPITIRTYIDLSGLGNLLLLIPHRFCLLERMTFNFITVHVLLGTERKSEEFI